MATTSLGTNLAGIHDRTPIRDREWANRRSGVRLVLLSAPYPVAILAFILRVGVASSGFLASRRRAPDRRCHYSSSWRNRSTGPRDTWRVKPGVPWSGHVLLSARQPVARRIHLAAGPRLLLTLMLGSLGAIATRGRWQTVSDTVEGMDSGIVPLGFILSIVLGVVFVWRNPGGTPVAVGAFPGVRLEPSPVSRFGQTRGAGKGWLGTLQPRGNSH